MFADKQNIWTYDLGFQGRTGVIRWVRGFSNNQLRAVEKLLVEQGLSSFSMLRYEKQQWLSPTQLANFIDRDMKRLVPDLVYIPGPAADGSCFTPSISMQPAPSRPVISDDIRNSRTKDNTMTKTTETPRFDSQTGALLPQPAVSKIIGGDALEVGRVYTLQRIGGKADKVPANAKVGALYCALGDSDGNFDGQVEDIYYTTFYTDESDLYLVA